MNGEFVAWDEAKVHVLTHGLHYGTGVFEGVRGYGTMGLFPLDATVDVTIAAWEWGAYLGEESKRNGIRAKVSSWRRISPDSLMPHAKASGQYLNSVLAKIESHKAGYEEAILLDDQGRVCEGSGENVFAVR